MTRFRFLTLSLALLLATGQASVAQEKSATDAELVKPFVGETTIVIAKVDPARLALPEIDKVLGVLPPQAKAALTNASKRITTTLELLRTMADDQSIFATVGIPGSQTGVPVFGFRRKTSEQNATTIKALLQDKFGADVYFAHGCVIAKPKNAARATAANRDVSAALKATADYPVQLMIIPPAYVWRTINELSPELPEQLGGGPSRTLTDGVQWASIGMDPKRLKTAAVIQSANEEAARAFAKHLPKMLTAMFNAAQPIRQAIPPKFVEALVQSLERKVEGDQVRVVVDGLEKNSFHLAIVAALTEAADTLASRSSNERRFKQILLAMHNYHDVYRSFPPQDKHRNKEGKHGLSWRVHILPFIEQQELYNQFRLNEPWDSEHNKKLIAKMPDIYARGSLIPTEDNLQPGLTTFQAPVGVKTIFGGKKATTFRNITDGTSNTAVLVDTVAEKAVPWTAPDDFVFAPENPLKGIRVDQNGKWLCAVADGSVQQFNSKVPAKLVLRLFQMNDGTPLDWDAFR